MEEEIKDLTENEVLMLALYKQALILNLDLFIFEKEELRKYFTIDETKDFAIAIISKNRDNAICNLQNKRRCYVINDYMKEINENKN